MGFGRGKGFTAIKEKVTIGTIVSKVVKGTSTAQTTEGKLISIKATEVTPAAFDIGSPAIARPGTTTADYTMILKENPASRSGIITGIEVYAAVSCVALEVGIFYSTGVNQFSTRSNVSIGAVAAGSKKTFEVSLAVEIGDYIGFYEPTGKLERTNDAGEGYWYVQLDAIPAVDQAFTDGTDLTRTISLYGTG